MLSPMGEGCGRLALAQPPPAPAEQLDSPPMESRRSRYRGAIAGSPDLGQKLLTELTNWQNTTIG